MVDTLLDRLRRHALLHDAPEAELEWLISNAPLRTIKAGELLSRSGAEVASMFVILSGHLAIHLERAYGRRKVMEWHGGDATGVLPYSRMKASPGDVRAVEDTDILMLPRALVTELPTVCPAVTASLVHAMVDRARRFTSSDLHDQRTLALGKVAAGLAHELNNPASALIRSGKTLAETVDRAHLSEPLSRLRDLDVAALRSVEELFEACRRRPPVDWGAMERADREQAIEEWLERSGEDVEVAAVLADSPLELEELFGLSRSNGPTTVAAVCHAARVMVVGQLAAEVEEGATRIFELVAAVKRFSHMDQTMTAAPVDLAQGLRDAAALVAEKARQASVTITLDLAPEHPPVVGVVEELNQLWHSILDNAVDAATPGGTVQVTSAPRDGRVRVEVRDDGPGIPDEIRDRIFDPFFTTKPVGRGAGLGLALARRVVDEHHGGLDIASRPGETVVRVELDSSGSSA
jgi:signal transduction histidine kinase